MGCGWLPPTACTEVPAQPRPLASNSSILPLLGPQGWEGLRHSPFTGESIAWGEGQHGNWCLPRSPRALGLEGIQAQFVSPEFTTPYPPPSPPRSLADSQDRSQLCNDTDPFGDRAASSLPLGPLRSPSRRRPPPVPPPHLRPEPRLRPRRWSAPAAGTLCPSACLSVRL